MCGFWFLMQKGHCEQKLKYPISTIHHDDEEMKAICNARKLITDNIVGFGSLYISYPSNLQPVHYQCEI